MDWYLWLNIILVVGSLYCITIKILSRFCWQDLEVKPWYVRFGNEYIYVFVFLCVLRNWGFEPYRIPSGSMLPTLQNGDVILVERFAYGLRVPIVNGRFTPWGHPERGDVVVFQFPKNTKEAFIKRVIGLPGDTIAYKNRQLTVNGKVMDVKRDQPYVNPEQADYTADIYHENLNGVKHNILWDTKMIPILPKPTFAHGDQCHMDGSDFTCKVPKGMYFVMGDNRDHSYDSRFWGFVPDHLLLGKAVSKIFNLKGHFNRIGSIN